MKSLLFIALFGFALLSNQSFASVMMGAQCNAVFKVVKIEGDNYSNIVVTESNCDYLPIGTTVKANEGKKLKIGDVIKAGVERISINTPSGAMVAISLEPINLSSGIKLFSLSGSVIK